MARLSSIGELEQYRSALMSREEKGKTRVTVCMTGCRAYGAAAVMAALQDEVRRQGLSAQVEIRPTGCHGFCAKAPVMAIDPLGIQYQEVTPDDAAEIVSLSIKKNQLLDRLAYKDVSTGSPIPHRDQIPFYRKQVKRVLANCGKIDPTKIEHYIAADGYRAVAKALSTLTPEQVIEAVTASTLKGRGGAGFSTGLKWQFARQAQGRPKYIVCNADEGDPGAFMDRAVLEGDPHAVMEGMLLGAYAIGAEHGYIYVREEYHCRGAPDHRHRTDEETGLLREHFGTGFI
jgi:NADH-quinone oxidoreductase subunit F